MLLWQVLGVPLLFVPFCVSSAPLEGLLSVSEQLKQSIKEALQCALVVDYLSPIYLSIILSFDNDSFLSSTFFEHVCAKHEFFQDVPTGRETPGFWSGLIESHFCDFATTNKVRAQSIVDRIVLKSHPFAAELQGRFAVGSFLESPDRNLEHFFTDAINEIFKQQLASLFARPAHYPLSETQEDFCRLLYKYKQSIPQLDMEHKYIHALLMNISFDKIHPFAHIIAGCEDDACSCLKSVAAAVFHRSTKNIDETLDEAQSALAALSPTVYAAAPDKRYEAVMRKYVVSVKEPKNPKVFGLVVAETLENTQITSRLPPPCLSIMRGIKENDPVCSPLLRHACDYFSAEEVLAKKKVDYFWVHVTKVSVLEKKSVDNFWVHVINRSFLELAENSQDQAREIIEKVVIPDHPILSEEAETEIGQMIGALFEGNEELTLFLEEKARVLVLGKLYEIMNSRDAKAANLEYIYLMQKHSMSESWHDESSEYAFAFLMRLGLEGLKILISQFGAIEHCLSVKPSELACTVYETMRNGTLDQALQAQAALNALPSTIVYPVRFKDYAEAVKDHIGRKDVPLDLKFVKNSIKSTLKLPEMEKNFSPAYLHILRALTNEKDSKSYQDFLCFIFQNHFTTHANLTNSWQIFFWRSLILSSLYRFAEEQPQQAGVIIEQVHALNNTLSEQLNQSLEEQCMVLADGLLERLYETDLSYLGNVLEFGHKTTLNYLLHRNNSIALQFKQMCATWVIRSGSVDVLKCLVENVQGINFEVPLTLTGVFETGHVSILKCLIEEGRVHANHRDGYLVSFVAGYGDIRMVKYLIEDKGVGASSHDGKALLQAARYNHMQIVKYLMEEQRVNARYLYDEMFFVTQVGGHFEVIEYLSKNHNADFHLCDGRALCQAAAYDNVATVKYIFGKTIDPNASCGQALTRAVEHGFVDSVKFLVLSGGKVSADFVSQIKEKQCKLLCDFFPYHTDDKDRTLEKQDFFFKREDILTFLEAQGAIYEE